MTFEALSELDRFLVVYGLAIGAIAELVYLWSVWPELALWHIVAATGLASIMVIEVYVMCSMVFRLIAVMNERFHGYEAEVDDAL